MTFRIPRINVVESDDGFSVEVVSPTEIRYMENGGVWRISSEFLSDDTTPLVIYRDTIMPISGLTNAQRSPAMHRDEMIANIRQAFRFRGIEIQVM